MEHLKHWLGDLFDEIGSNKNSEVCLGLLKNAGRTAPGETYCQA